MKNTVSDVMHELKLTGCIYTDTNLENEIEHHINTHSNIRLTTFLANHRDITGELPSSINVYDFGMFTVILMREYVGRKAIVIRTEEICAYHLVCTFSEFLVAIRDVTN